MFSTEQCEYYIPELGRSAARGFFLSEIQALSCFSVVFGASVFLVKSFPSFFKRLHIGCRVAHYKQILEQD